MIRPLRIAHRVAWMVLAVALPAILLAALLSRHALPAEQQVASIGGAKQLSRSRSFQFRREGNSLFITAARPLDYPDVLAYWSPESRAISENSKLLGPFNTASVNRYEIESGTGNIVLYSLPNKVVIDSAPLGGSR